MVRPWWRRPWRWPVALLGAPRPRAEGPAPYVEIVITVYELGVRPDGRLLLDVQHDVMSFRDQRAQDFGFVRSILTMVAGSLPVPLPTHICARPGLRPAAPSEPPHPDEEEVLVT